VGAQLHRNRQACSAHRRRVERAHPHNYTGELLAVVVPHDAPLSSSADQGGGKRRLGIAWSFDAAANYFNSCSRVNLAYGDDTMRVTHTFDYVALGVLIARPIIIALFSL
jgi:hypothetical protein